jgi:hypothetical protein
MRGACWGRYAGIGGLDSIPTCENRHVFSPLSDFSRIDVGFPGQLLSAPLKLSPFTTETLAADRAPSGLGMS